MAQFLDEGRLAPDELVISIVAERLEQRECKNGCLLDGFPRTLAQAQALDKMLEQHAAPINAVLWLSAPEEVLLRRLAGRGRSDDQPEAIRRRLKQYDEETKPLREYYQQRGILHKIDGVGSQDEVYGRIRAAIDKE